MKDMGEFIRRFTTVQAMVRREINLALAASGAGGKRIVELVAGAKNSRLQFYRGLCFASVVA